MGMDGIIAETTDLAIGYRNRKRVATVMKGLTLRARHGELVALIGRNGTGKSTLLRTLAGIQPSLAGEILIEGSPLSGLGAARLPRMVSFVSTEPVALRNIRVRDVVALGRFPYTNWIGTLTKEDNEVVESALEATGIAGLAGRSIDSISDGEKQRTLVA
ncbi:MAG: ABC transporter ATP-binding protein, partial [Bacteroidales bacterium]